jgi:hypothetical protein
MEKFKRLKSLVVDGEDYLLHLPNEPDARGDKFLKSIEWSESKIINYRGGTLSFFPLLFLIWAKTLMTNRRRDLGFFIFQGRMLLELIRYFLILEKTQAKLFLTANEDGWSSPVLAILCRVMGVMNINVMHGRVYDHKQYYDTSVVFGKTSYHHVSALASSDTIVVQAPLFAGVTKNRRVKNLYKKPEIIHFDQPPFQLFPDPVRNRVIRALENLKEAGFEVTVKLHPADLGRERTELKKFVCIDAIDPEVLTKKFDIATSACSTVGLELIEMGMPVVYFNFENILDNFLQISFLKPVSPKSEHEIVNCFEKLSSDDGFLDFMSKQQDLMIEEYASISDSVNLKQLIRDSV